MAQLLHFKLNSITLRYILLASLLLGLAAVGFISYHAQNLLEQKALAVDHAQTDAEYAQKEIEYLQQLQVDLEVNKEEIAKAAEIVAESQSFQYQNQIVNDVTGYAEKTGVSIAGFDFTDDKTDPSATSNSLSSAKKLIVMVRLADETEYTSFMRFLRSIEQNITKMQLTGLSLQPIPDNHKLLGQTVLELEVYIQ